MKPYQNLQDLRRNFSIIVRERKKETDPFAQNSVQDQLLKTLGSNILSMSAVNNNGT